MATALAGDGTVIYYETWGRGEPLMLVSGLATDLRIWACQRLVFGRRFRCIALDNRGSGRSGKPEGPYTLEQMAADAIAVLDAEGVGRAHVVGHSMGSYIAQMMAVQHPDRLRSLTLAGTACRHQPWRLDLLARWQETARIEGVHAWARRAFPYLLGPRTAWTLRPVHQPPVADHPPAARPRLRRPDRGAARRPRCGAAGSPKSRPPRGLAALRRRERVDDELGRPQRQQGIAWMLASVNRG